MCRWALGCEQAQRDAIRSQARPDQRGQTHPARGETARTRALLAREGQVSAWQMVGKVSSRIGLDSGAERRYAELGKSLRTAARRVAREAERSRSRADESDARDDGIRGVGWETVQIVISRPRLRRLLTCFSITWTDPKSATRYRSPFLVRTKARQREEDRLVCLPDPSSFRQMSRFSYHVTDASKRCIHRLRTKIPPSQRRSVTERPIWIISGRSSWVVAEGDLAKNRRRVVSA